MKKILVSFLLTFALTSFIYSHLCNDVFIQAKDNLAIKVDIRDNQLRISKEAEFRVYLLNTMDRDIVNIQLKIVSDDFNSTVTPSPTWHTFPLLETKNKGGTKEYYKVKLIRKKETAEGIHKIGLRLFNGRDSSMIFKTVNIEDAIGCALIPKKSQTLKIDGNATKDEWGNSYLCTNFYEYLTESVKGNMWFRKQKVNKDSPIQTRIRFMHGEKKLYALIDFQEKTSNDEVKIYIADEYNSQPKVISVKLDKQTTSTKKEIEIPLDIKDTFFVNATRRYNDTITYFSGNESSVEDPVVYATFKLE
ncbi:hypothetical protein ACFL4A_02315 [bacterium]